MAPRISLALALHNHQPVGNFGWVFAEVFEQAYQPMVEALERHPGVRLSLHYTGPLLEWLRAERPEFIDRLRALVDRGQVEILGGGYYEPVLASLPERDRIGQLRRMGDELEALFGRRPRGAWLAERVWEPDLPTSLVAGRLRLDDPRRRPLPGGGDPRGGPVGPVHDRGPGPPAARLRHRAGPALPDPVPRRRGGHRLPARPRDRGRRPGRDDGRRRREVRGVADHLGALLGRGPLGRPVLRGARGERRLADHDDAVGLAGRRTRRSGGSTSRPARTPRWASGRCRPTRAVVFTAVLHAAPRTHDRPEARWLRGAFWRNFQVKYREINDLHKQMLRTSDKVDAMPRRRRPRRAPSTTSTRASRTTATGTACSAASTSATCGWRRTSTSSPPRTSPTRAAGRARRRRAARPRPRRARRGPAGRARARSSTVDLTEGAGIGGWDIRAVRHALARSCAAGPRPTTRRSAEHEADGAAAARPRRAGDAPGLDPRHRHGPRSPASPSGSTTTRTSGAPGSSASCRRTPTAEAWATAAAASSATRSRARSRSSSLEPGRLVVDARRRRSAGRAARRPCRVTKRSSIGGDRRSPDPGADGHGREPIRPRARRAARPRVDADDARRRRQSGGLVGGRRRARQPRRARAATGVDDARPGQRLHRRRGRDHACPSRPTLWWAPVETISNSEAGFERVYQGAGLLLSWPLALAAGASRDGRA